VSDTSGPVSILCVSCLMIYHNEIHFTTLYMTDLGTRAESLGEGARVEKGEGKERQKPLWRREGMQHVRTAYLFSNICLPSIFHALRFSICAIEKAFKF
jgi:hypothetical protein